MDPQTDDSDDGLGPVAGVDIDGVVSDPSHRLHHIARRPKDWRGFFAAAERDPALPAGVAAVRDLQDRGVTIVYVSGRPEFLRVATQRWLARHGLPDGPVHLRAPGDFRPAAVVKREIYDRIARTFDLVEILDDDADVVAELRAAGLPATRADWFAPADPLHDAQEQQGRT